MNIKQPFSQSVADKFSNLPQQPRIKLLEIRNLVFDVAVDNDLGPVEETLKWGEPAYLIKGGSTVRIDWKAKSPDKIYIFFNCNTLLVETFRTVYSDVFVFQGNRAMELDIDRPIPIEALKHCLFMALQYHKIKHLPLLGV